MMTRIAMAGLAIVFFLWLPAYMIWGTVQEAQQKYGNERAF